jgi:putative membrane protein
MKTRISIPAYAVTISLACGLAACGETQANESPQAPQTTAASTEANPPAGGAAAPRAPMTNTSSVGTDAALSDGQIAKIADTANSGEMEQGRYAVAHATDARVKQFAQHMVSAHGGIGQTMTTVLQKESIVPAASPVSSKLGADAQSTLASLEGKSGAGFDRSYIDAQAKEHKDVLDLFDNTLIPNAKDAQLKAALQQVRPMVAEHLKEAEDLQKTLAP